MKTTNNLTLGQAYDIFQKNYDSLSGFSPEPFYQQEHIPLIIKLLENPSYCLRIGNWELFPGKTSLLRHDLIHCLFNKDATRESEAFIIGYSMGITGRMSMRQARWYLRLLDLFSHKRFHFSGQARVIFLNAVQQGINNSKRGIPDITAIPLENLLDESLDNLQKQFSCYE